MRTPARCSIVLGVLLVLSSSGCAHRDPASPVIAVRERCPPGYPRNACEVVDRGGDEWDPHECDEAGGS